MSDTPEIEHTLRVIPIDDHFFEEIAKINKDGWELMNGITPVAVYHLARIKGTTEKAASVSGLGTLGIDDSKVFIIPAQKN